MTKTPFDTVELEEEKFICTCKSPLHKTQKDREHFISKHTIKILRYGERQRLKAEVEKVLDDWWLQIMQLSSTSTRLEELKKRLGI